MKKSLILLVAGLSFSVSAANYGMAGCGLGSIAMGPKGSQVSAGTTNSSTGTQFFGITSGTSNCAEDGVALKQSEVNSFAEANFETLKSEMAQGKGENLTVLASLMGCDAAKLSSSVRADYGSIFDRSDVTPVQMLDRVGASASCATR
ncbi:MAG: DUF3015 family protein [Fibrobacteres bacterium]|jgi:hypothetical protein|nr:DUF3015 family protein [Fibrobacterota bacterium]